MSYTYFQEDIKAYGIKIDSAGTVTRIGLAKGMSRADFDNIPLFNLQKRCTLADAGTINHYFGDGGYLEDGTDGQVMVQRPAFYYAWFRRGTTDYYYVSDVPCVGLTLHPAFMRNNVFKRYIYLSAYEGSAYDVSGVAYLLADEAGVDFTATTGDKMCSIAGAKPISGWRNTLTIANARQLCKNRGALWNQFDVLSFSAIQLLFMIEYASCDSQTMIGQGVTGVTDDGATNCAHNTGLTTALGNASGREAGTDNLCSVSYRGIENLWGNIWKFIDGVNIKANNGLWIADNGFVSDTYAAPYKSVGTLINADGYFKTPLFSEGNPVFFPSAVGGSSSTYFSDYYYQTTGNRIAISDGVWDSGASAGLFYWILAYASSFSYRYVGARLNCVP
jgi:hypothetical protein